VSTFLAATMNNALITIDAALNALASANSPDELVELANTAETLRTYARRAKLGMVAQNRCAELRLRAERQARTVARKHTKAARSTEKCSTGEHFAQPVRPRGAGSTHLAARSY
jgi:hypothetical protein